jgi:hypothetical protein
VKVHARDPRVPHLRRPLCGVFGTAALGDNSEVTCRHCLAKMDGDHRPITLDDLFRIAYTTGLEPRVKVTGGRYVTNCIVVLDRSYDLADPADRRALLALMG